MKYKLFDSLTDAQKKIPFRKAVSFQAGHKIICVMNTDKGIAACDNICPHKGYPIDRGTVNHLNEIVCPWHQYRYNLNHGQECHNRSFPIEVYEVETTDEGVFVTIPEKQPHS